jgi:hypothetical protein
MSKVPLLDAKAVAAGGSGIYAERDIIYYVHTGAKVARFEPRGTWSSLKAGFQVTSNKDRTKLRVVHNGTVVASYD